jgi:hypothetical protein
MKNNFYIILSVMFVAFVGIGNVSAQEIDSKIKEVFKDAPDDYLNSDPVRITFLTELLNTRISIIESPVNEKEAYKKLSEVPLLNKYNASLTRDLVFDPLNFNPLKYNFEISSSTAVMAYRVDNTNYIIVIKPQIKK